MAYNILVVDDEQSIADLIELYLQNENYHIFKYYCGKDALESLQKNHYDLAILDVMMPDLDGFSLLKEIRKHYYFPVIMLTAKNNDLDKINGLTLGADDYLTKPFNPLELIARVNSCIRRYVNFGNLNSQEQNKVLKTGGLELYDETKQVIADGKEIKLTATEYNILKFLLENKGKVYSISQIYENVWNEESYGAENIIAVHIRHIREKIEINPKEPKYLKVIWGIGYKVENI